MTIESPYRRGADDGMKFGLYLTALLAGILLSGGAGALSGLLTLTLIVATPVLLCFMMWRYHRHLGEASGFGMLWLDGTMTVMFGLLIASVFFIIYMKWINPDFVVDQLRSIITLDADNPDLGLTEYADTARALIDNHEVPSPALMASSFLVTGMMAGVIASGVIAVIIIIATRLTGKHN